MNVEEVMNKRVEFVEANATILDVIERLVNRRIRSVVVKPKDERDTYGVITVRDVVFKCLAKNLDPQKVKAHEIASKPLITVEKGMSIEHVLSLMGRFNIARVFVKEGEKIVGVVALMDIMSAYLVRRLL
ncbi:MAG: CBS domain-containing protein [Archaeoglobaceae archaeon]|uniref:CBS domain-containing protein n=1 Tax=Archaeoglobus fulgidus TaxID=2234 RepID=A0A7J3M3Z1_ARCFL